MTHNITAMLVMAQERRSTLVNALESCGFDVLPVCDCNEARRMLEAQLAVQVVVTDAPDYTMAIGGCLKLWREDAERSR